MENIIEYLNQLDLSEAEAKLYLTLLKTGPASVRELAQTVDIKRTTAYFYIDQLVEKGLIMKLVRGSKKLVAANEPDNLKILVEEKLKKANEVQKKFPEVLKMITGTLPQESNTNDAEFKYYKGKNGVKKIYDDVLKEQEIRSYVNIEEIAKVFPENFDAFNKVFQKNAKITMFEIVENSPQANKYINFSKNKPGYHQKLLPKDMSLAAQDILIYNQRVAIINLRGNIHGIILYNIDLYNNFKMLFDLTWKMLS